MTGASLRGFAMVAAVLLTATPPIVTAPVPAVAAVTTLAGATAGSDSDAVPVGGADRPTTAAPLLTPGRYTDTFSRGGIGEYGAMGTTKYYVIAARPGVRPYISVTLSPPDTAPGDGQLFGVEVTLLDSTSDVCTGNAADDVPAQGRHQPVVAVLDGPVFGDPAANASCPTDELAILQVNRIGEAYADRPLDAEIVVRMEPPADPGGLPGPAPAGADLPVPAHAIPTDLAGGDSFTDAPTVSDGATYRATIRTGELRYYRIPLRWGQRFAYLISEVGPADPALGPPGVEVAADVFNPVRAHDAFASTGSTWFGAQPGAAMTADTDYPVRYTNRDGVDQKPYALDGDYYLRLGAYRNDPASTTSFVLTVTIHGAPQTGPSYLPIDPAGSAGNGAPVTAAGAPTAQADPVPQRDDPLWVWWLAVPIVAAGGLAAVLWSRRRSARQVARHR